MKIKLTIRLLFFALLLVVPTSKAVSQCFQIESILVAACIASPGTEGYNEMVRFKVGAAPVNVGTLTVNWPAQAWQGLVQNATTAASVAAINADIALAGGCGQLIEPTGGVIPANAEVVLITSQNFSATANVFGAITQNIYVIFQDNTTVTAGHFGNYNATPGIRTLSMSFGGGCTDTVSYERSNLSPNQGATANFTPAGTPSYTNPGCVAPVEVFSVDAGTTPVTACPGDVISLTGTAVGAATINGWTAPSGTFSTPTALVTNYTLAGTATGSITLTLSVTNSCGNTITDTVVVNVSPTVTPTFNPITVCAGAADPLPTTSSNSITGTWSPAFNNAATATYTFTPNAGQCASTTTLTVTVTPLVTPTFNAISVCPGAPDPLPATSTNGITGTWSPAFNNAATATYTFTPNAGQCAATTTLIVTVTSSITPTFNPITVCTGAADPLLATSTNGITGTWSPAFNSAVTATYTFTPNAGQCATTTTLTVTVTNSITPTFNPITVCTGAADPLQTTSTNGITGTWSPAFNNTATATYIFTPNAGQCAATTTLTVTVTALTTPTFNPIAVCTGAANPLPATSTNGITGIWSPAYNNAATATYTFTPNAGQCASTTTLTVTVNPATTPTFAAIAPICAGAANPLLTTSTNGIVGTWSPAFNNAATATYTFTPNTGQCASTTTLTVTVNPATIPTFAAIAPICAGAANPLLTTSTNGIVGTWSPAFNNAATATYTFTPNAGQCASITTLTVTVNPATIPTFAAIAPICIGAANPLQSTSTNGIAGTWSPAFNNAATATYTFTPNAGQCAATTTLTVTVRPLVTPTFNIATPVCTGTPIVLPATSTNGISGTWSPAPNNLATTTYTFTPTVGQCAGPVNITVVVTNAIVPIFSGINQLICGGDPLPPLPTISNNGITGSWSPALNNLVSTVYTFTPNSGQCAVNATLGITVNDPIIPLFDAATIPVFICRGQPLASLPVVSQNGIPGTWSPAIDNMNTTTYTFTPTAGLCATINSLTINVIDPVTKNETYFICIDAAGNPTTSATINTNLSSPQYSFAWFLDSNPIANTADFYLATQPGIYTVEATNTLTGCVTNTIIAEVKGVLPATATAQLSNDFADAQQIVVTVVGGLGSYEYQLNGGAYQTSNVFSIYEGGEYTIHVKDNLGCNDFTLTVTALNYPKFFTPNNDGYHDFWNIEGLTTANKAEIYIFDRYGKLLKQISPLGQGWDGSYNGTPMPGTDYWFKLLYTDKNGIRKEFNSHFALKR
ncbi:MAG TPA: T9SS type B sorting domain-containing protein [Flavobacterium sp.]|nr:T9SS type B sorting domain-containing protein [Flavobacterium sp.]HPJ09041.1 T9SS type B sorting domain-containing protein [Flavobacterium sp.]